MISAIDNDIENPPKFIDTKFGRARINTNGYYQITTHKEGNWHKQLHRLIFEDFYNIKIEKEFPEKMVIHHIDGNKTNNNIWNLDIMTVTEHRKLHMTGENNPNYGKPKPMEVRKKIGDGNRGKTIEEKSKQLMSKSHNTTGFYRVYKRNDPTCTQGFVWSYRFYTNSTNRKVFSRTNLIELMEKVKSENLPWLIINEDTAKQTCKTYNYDFNILEMEAN